MPWVREISVDAWMTDQQTHSYVAGLPSELRIQLVSDLRAILDRQFPDGQMRVPYETWLWVATRS